MKTIEYILNRCEENDFKAADLDLINEVYKLYDKYEMNPQHALNVAEMVTNLNADVMTIIVPFLYDLVVNNALSLDEVSERYGEEAYNLIDNLIKMDNIKLNDYNE